jgi:hypothetical protein
MSIDPHWFKGHYLACILFLFVSGITKIAMVTLYLKSVVSCLITSHIHDLAKNLLFGFSAF